MATKTYWVRFGNGDPRTYAGLAPTFLLFYNSAGSAISPPSIAEIAASSGLYTFAWGTTLSMGFLIDAATTSPGTIGRYVTGSLDPSDLIDQYGTSLIALGTTSVALGTTSVALGTTSVSWGSANSTALTNQGSTLVGIGNTGIALGTTGVALGTTSVSWGSANNTAITNQGSTLVGIGNTAIALGTTGVALGTTAVSWGLANSTALTNQGSTLVAIGNTSIAYGGTISQKITNEGVTLVAIGNSLAAIGTSLSVIIAGIGSTASTYGGPAADPVDLFGYMKRIQENLEGNNTYIKSTGALSIYSRASATLLITKTITNSVTTVIKT